MTILRNPDSDEAKEYAKWEMLPSEWTIGALRPGNPYRKGNDFGKPGAEYPRMLYKAHPIPGSGKMAVALQEPEFFGFRDQNEWDRACQSAARFTASCQKTVSSEAEHERARDDGWRDSPQEAMDFSEALQKAISNAAAERNYRDRNMGEKAKEESAAAEAEHFGHLPEIPEKPKRKYVRKKAASAPAA